MNLVLADTEEFRRVKRKPKAASAAPGASTSAPVVEAEEKRTLGLTIVRGAHIISLSVEGEPPADPSARLGTSAPGATMAAGPGTARPAGRGLPVGLTVRLTANCMRVCFTNIFAGPSCRHGWRTSSARRIWWWIWWSWR